MIGAIDFNFDFEPKKIHPVGKLEVKLVNDCPHVVGAPLSHRRHKHWDNPEQRLLNFS